MAFAGPTATANSQDSRPPVFVRKWPVGSANLPCSARGYGSDGKPLSVAHNVMKISDSNRFALSIIRWLKDRRENEGANGYKGKQQPPTSSFEAATSLIGKHHCS